MSPKASDSRPTLSADGHESWRLEPEYRNPQRRAWLLIRRLSLTLLVVGLIITLLWLLLSVRHHVPVVAVLEADYRPPYGPLALVEEDRIHLKRFSRSETGLLQPASIVWQDASQDVADAPPEEFLAALARRAAKVRPGGPGNAAVIIYLAMLGTVNEQGEPCLLTSTATPFTADETALVPLERLVRSVRDVLPSRVDLLVVIDGCQQGLGWPLGIADGGFAPAVEAWVRGSRPERTWIMLSAAAGQRPHGDPSEGASVFARHFAAGLRGAADAKPFGDDNGRVGLGELTAYLDTEVDRWARLHFGEPQRPVLFPSATEAGSQAVPQVAWTISKDPEEMTPTGSQRPPSSIWLSTRWQAAEQLAASVHTMPLVWQEYLQLLLRAEHLTRSGRSYSAERSRVETLVERLELRLATSRLTEAAALPSLSKEQLSIGAANVDPNAVAAWQVAMKARETPPPKDTKPSSADRLLFPTQAAWLDHSRAGWQWLTRRDPAGLPVDQRLLAAWLEELGPAPSNVLAEPVEIHTARMLSRWLDESTWQRDPGLPIHLLRLLGLSRSAALSPDVRADRVVDLVTDRLSLAADLRQAIDRLLVGDADSLQAARKLADAVAPRLEETVRVANEASQSIRFSDRLHDELPWLAAWWVGEQRAARAAASGPVGALASPPTIDWRKLLEAVNRFERAIDDVFRSADQRRLVTSPDEAITALAAPRREVDVLFRTLSAAYFTACEELAVTAPDSPQTRGRIDRILRTPLARGQQRVRLLERATALRRFSEAAGATSTDIPRPDDPDSLAAVTAGWVNWQQVASHPLIPALAIDEKGSATLPTQPAEIAAAVARQLFAVHRAVESLPASLITLERKNDDAGRRSAARAYLESGEFLTRRMAALIGFREIPPGVSSVQANLVASWHDRLLSAAAESIEDFWDGIQPDDLPWFLRSATAYLQSAAQLVQATGVPYGGQARRDVESRLAAAAAATGLGVTTINPEVLTIFPPAFPVEPPPHRVQFDAERGLPGGVAALWFADSVKQRPFPIATPAPAASAGPTSAAAPVARLALPFDPAARPATVSWRLTDEGRRLLNAREAVSTGRSGVIDMVVWFRGHRLVTALPVLAAGSVRTTEWQATPPLAPAVTVRGDVTRNQTVAVIFDCSGSMGQRLGDGRTRLEAGREALAQVLETMARQGGWNASLWLYGHRTRWSRDQRGRFTAGFTKEGERQRDAVRGEGKPFTLLPGDDVERVFDMQPLSPLQVVAIREQLDRQKPGGETPLYRAIEEAIRVDLSTAEPGPAHVLVVTDGANDQSGGKIVTPSDVQRLLSLVNFKRSARDHVRVDVIGFDLDMSGYDRQLRLQELQSLAADSGGEYFDARDPRRLAESLRKSLRMIRWQARTGTAPPLTAAVGEPLRLPVPFAAGGDVYDISLEAEAARRRVTVHGGEALELFLGGGNRLVFQRYTGGLEQGLRDQRADIPDPIDPDRRWFVGGHLARRVGTTVHFPISIQSGPADGFSPRPVELWVEVTPQSSRGRVAAPYVVYDPAWQPHRPVPVLDVTATGWPDAATTAEVRSWFRFTTAEPLLGLPVADMVPDVELTRDLPGLEGSSLRVRLSPVSDPSVVRLTVIETHPPRLADQLPLLKVAISSGCRRAVHIVEPGTGRIRHEFELDAVDGQLPGGMLLTATDREAIIRGSIGTGIPGTTIQPLVIPVPPR
jgi:hypothetical protein